MLFIVDVQPVGVQPQVHVCSFLDLSRNNVQDWEVRLTILATTELYLAGQNDYQNNSKIILICNFHKQKLPGKLNSFKVGNGNFEIFEIIRGSGNFEQKNRKSQNRTTTHTTHFIMIFSILSSSLVFCLVFRLVFRVVFSCLSSCLLLSLVFHRLFSLSLPLSSFCVSVLCSLSLSLSLVSGLWSLVSVSVSVQEGLAGQGRVRDGTLKPCA